MHDQPWWVEEEKKNLGGRAGACSVPHHKEKKLFSSDTAGGGGDAHLIRQGNTELRSSTRVRSNEIVKLQWARHSIRRIYPRFKERWELFG